MWKCVIWDKSNDWNTICRNIIPRNLHQCATKRISGEMRVWPRQETWIEKPSIYQQEYGYAFYHMKKVSCTDKSSWRVERKEIWLVVCLVSWLSGFVIPLARGNPPPKKRSNQPHSESWSNPFSARTISSFSQGKYCHELSPRLPKPQEIRTNSTPGDSTLLPSRSARTSSFRKCESHIL